MQYLKTPSLWVLALCLPVGAWACIWGEKTPVPKPRIPTELFRPEVDMKPMPPVLEIKLVAAPVKPDFLAKTVASPEAEYARIIVEYERNPAAHASFSDRNDYAAALLYLHRYAAAVAVLVGNEQAYPGQYATAANLGTAYELSGDVDRALHWIKEGIRRNPASHEGTEWLHVAILETKLQLKSNPRWLAKNSVLDPHRRRPEAELAKALEYQLNERLYFIKADDPIMCDLFYEAARLSADADKKAYFIQQAKLFGTIRQEQLKELERS
jgi:hypothetical protein